jgi:hypothetical protein
MAKRPQQSGESSQIHDPEKVNFSVPNAAYRLLSGSEVLAPKILFEA